MVQRALFSLAAALVFLGLSGSAPAGLSGWQEISPPAGPGAMAPSLALAGKDVVLTWLEPLGPAAEATAPAGHRLRFARLSGGRWSAPATVVSGPGFFANWADFPAVAQAPDGSLMAHWLAKTGEGTYAYGIFLARSTDGGASWKKAGLLHEDRTPQEHGFVSWIVDGSRLRAFWLDGREMARKGPMALRTALLEGGTVRPSEVVDDRVCDCCQTDAALAAAGPVVAYRDRTPQEVRDIYVVRRTASGWSEPVRIGSDNWQIPGCPVNGPAIAASGRRVAVAWFTGAPPGPRVQIAFSEDGGATFGKPLLIDGDKPLGRLDLALDRKGDALVSWLVLDGNDAAVRLRRASAKGELGKAMTVAKAGSVRAIGVPRLVMSGERLYLAWVDDAEGARRVRVGVYTTSTHSSGRLASPRILPARR